MLNGFENLLGVHEQALALQSRRTQLIGSNLANAETPGFKARDIDFKQALVAAQSGGMDRTPLRLTRVAHIQPLGDAFAADILYRTPNQPSLDGNSVETHVEMAKFSENAMRYLTSLRIVNGRLNKLLTAFRGE